ncbi:MAG TPA: hypothetical protein VMT52_05250, partial [Planctomycetota bacterium]|nr:hypothetical protein [Planctomycetota bacterium]
ILSFRLGPEGLTTGPVGVLAYKGQGQSTVLGLEQGPDGIYFTDFFGEQMNGMAAGMGRVIRVAPSARTKSLPAASRPERWERWSPAERGKFLFSMFAGCGACHAVRRLSEGREGPELNHLLPRLRSRLDSEEYLSQARMLRDGSDEETSARLDEVLAARGDEKLRAWLRAHIQDPRFDNPRAKMPQYTSFSREDVGYLIDFLMTLE